MEPKTTETETDGGNDQKLTVAQLYDLCRRLVEHGKGDLPVWIHYDSICVSQARSVDVRLRGSQRWRGVYISESEDLSAGRA